MGFLLKKGIANEYFFKVDGGSGQSTHYRANRADLLVRQRLLSCDKVVVQMVRAVEVADDDFPVGEIKTADRAVVQQEPGFQLVCALTPGQFEHRAHQVHEKAAMADDGDVLFGLVFAVAVPSQQVSQEFVGARLALFLSLEGAVPPTGFVEMRGQCQFGELLGEIRTRFSGQSLLNGFIHAAENSALFMDFWPGCERDAQGTGCRRGCIGSPRHQAAVDVSQAKTVAVLAIFTGRSAEGLVLGEEIGCAARLYQTNLGQLRIRAFLIMRVLPVGIILGLSVTYKVELHGFHFAEG